MEVRCTRCNNMLALVDTFPNLASVSIRCRCAARYHVVGDAVTYISDMLEELTTESVDSIVRDPRLTHNERIPRLSRLASQARKAANSLSSAYNLIASQADKACEGEITKADKQLTELLARPADTRIPLLRAMCIAKGVAFDESKSNSIAYLDAIAEQVGV